jgi:hypothetical protein
MQKLNWLRTGFALGASLALSACGGSDSEFCSMLDQVKTTILSDEASLRGERAGPSGTAASAYKATKSLPDAVKCEIYDGDSGLVVYSCDYPGTAIEALRDRVDACGGEKLAWDESGKQWYRGADKDLTLSVTTNEAAGSADAVSAIIYTHF